MESDFLSGPYGIRLKEIVGEEHIDRIVDSFSLPKRTSFRVNTILSSIDAVTADLKELGVEAESISWCEEAFSVAPEERQTLTHSDLAETGAIYVQGLSSIFASLCLSPVADQWNLDLASAPGGKASHMAALMDNRGKLSVVEPIKPRMYRLAANLKRLGVSISKIYLMDGRKVGRKVPDRFDRVMLDAPCSSDSRLRVDDPETWKYWSPRKVKEQSRKQKGLIISAYQSLKPGGVMLYCTCSFSPEENEAVVTHLLGSTDAGVVEIEMPFDNWTPGFDSFQGKEFDPAVRLTRRVLPNGEYDAFYLAKVLKPE